MESPTKDFDYWYTAIYYRNLGMIDQSDVTLFWVKRRENSGAYKTYRYAVKKQKRIVKMTESEELINTTTTTYSGFGTPKTTR